MDEHMMVSEIAALKNEIETLKTLAEKGLILDKAMVDIESELDRVNELWRDESMNIYYIQGQMNGLEYALDRMNKLDSMEDKTNV